MASLSDVQPARRPPAGPPRVHPAPEWTVDEHHGPSALADLRDEWDALHADADGSPFQSWDWAAAWLQAFGATGQVRIWCARHRGRLVAVLPLIEHTRSGGVPGLRTRVVQALGEGPGAADYVDVLATPAHRARATDALVDAVSQTVPFDILRLDQVQADSPLLPRLAHRFAPGRRFRHHLRFSYVCPQIDLSGGWDTILRANPRARYFRYCLRRLEALPTFAHRTVTAPDEATAAWDRFRPLHEGSWSGRGGSVLAGDEPLAAFLKDVVHRLAARGRVQFDELWFEGTCRASLMAFRSGQTHYYYLGGYDTTWAKYSPGFVLVGLSVRDAIARGARQYDFLRGDEAYKFEWANHSVATVCVAITRRTLPASLWTVAEHVRHGARVAAETAVPDWLLRLRRRLRGRGRATACLLAPVGSGAATVLTLMGGA